LVLLQAMSSLRKKNKVGKTLLDIGEVRIVREGLKKEGGGVTTRKPY